MPRALLSEWYRLERTGMLSVVQRFVARSVTCIVYLLPLAPCQLKCIIALGFVGTRSSELTSTIKKSKGYGLGQILLVSFQWVTVGRV